MRGSTCQRENITFTVPREHLTLSWDGFDLCRKAGVGTQLLLPPFFKPPPWICMHYQILEFHFVQIANRKCFGRYDKINITNIERGESDEERNRDGTDIFTCSIFADLPQILLKKSSFRLLRQ